MVERGCVRQDSIDLAADYFLDMVGGKLSRAPHHVRLGNGGAGAVSRNASLAPGLVMALKCFAPLHAHRVVTTLLNNAYGN